MFVDLPTELAEPAQPARGRHPLPSTEQFQEAARGWGISEGDVVVAYDDAGNMAAARAVVDAPECGLRQRLPARRRPGRLARAAGLPLKEGLEQAAPGDVTAHRRRHAGHRCAKAAGNGLPHGVLLDARAGERYRGEIRAG